MSTITPHYRTITELLKNRSFAIDEYQREYKWERVHIEELLSDLIAKFQTSYRDGDSTERAADYADYFLGSIIVTKRDNRAYLVDGQQRVTSLTLLLIHLFRVATEQALRVASTIEPLIFSDNFGKEDFNLAVPERTPAIRALFTGEDYNTDGKDESVRTIIDRYRDIEEIAPAAILGEAFATFVYWLLGRVGLIEIEAASDVHAYSIFETMNDRGKPLSPVDMLKAYLLAPVESADQRADANRVWKQTVLDLISWAPDPNPERDSILIKAWLRAQYAATSRDRKAGAIDKDWELIGSGFHRWLRDSEQITGSGGAERNLQIMTDEFPFFARTYQILLDAGSRYTPGLEAVYFNEAIGFTWQYTVLLAPLTVADDEDTVRRKFAATATYLDIWLMRRAVNHMSVDYSTVNYAMWLLCKEIRRKSVGELVDLLTARLAEDDVTFEGGGRRRRGGVQNMQLNQSSRRYIRHLLARVTAYVEVGAGRADEYALYMDRGRKNPFDIEHLWADKIRALRRTVAVRARLHCVAQRRGGVSPSAGRRQPQLPGQVVRGQGSALRQTELLRSQLHRGDLPASATVHEVLCNRGPSVPGVRALREIEQSERSALALANKVWSPDRLEDLRP